MSSKSNYFPKSPSANTITLGVWVSIYDFGGHIMQSIAVIQIVIST